MKKAFWNILKVSPAIALSLLTSNTAFAGAVNEQVTSVSQLSQDSNNLPQVTSVSQFSDVQPTDWAFQALQSLVERYGCTAGYPNGTFRGNRALSRYEFAAGLNSCLNRVNELIATATADMVSKQDLATLQRLQEEYSNELQTVKGQADALEARLAELEPNQFSTTTKLSGEAIFSLSKVFGDNLPYAGRRTDVAKDKEFPFNSKPTFSDRVRLTFNSSFRGTDQLQTRLNAGNIVQNNGTAAPGNITLNFTNTNMTRLGYDSGNNNSVSMDKLNYSFNLSDKIRVKIDATGGELNENVDVFNPDFRSSGSGALSRYGRFSPIYRQANDGAGITVNFKPNDKFVLSAAYFATGRDGATLSAPGTGLTDGNNTIFGQLAFKPNKAINLGLAYAHNYLRGGIALSGNPSAPLFGNTGSAYANGLDNINNSGDRTEANHYGLQVSLQPTPRITLGAWGGYTTANSIAPSDAFVRKTYNYEMFYWATTLGIKDFLKEGNTLGLIFGQSPRVTGATEDGKSVISDLNKRGIERNSSYHIEGLYKMKISDNVLVTPGVMVILNPENDDRNSTQYVGTLRTTFTF